MKVFELMAKLADLPASADVQCCCEEPEIFGAPNSINFDGKKADDSFVNINFIKSPDCD